MGTNDKHDIAKNLIEQEINAVMMMPTRVMENGHGLKTVMDLHLF